MIAATVIMPAFNAERYIHDAISSVQAQTYANHELLIIDDGSTDQTCSIVANASERDRRIRLITGTHQGVSRARNRGLDEARGRWISFLDADDLWQPNRLARHIDILSSLSDVSVVCGQVLVFESLGRDCEPSSNSDHVTLLGAYLSAATFQRSAIELIGRFDTTLEASEDLDFFLRVHEAGLLFHIDHAVALLHRRHQSNMTRDIHFTNQNVMRALAKSLNRRRQPGFVMPSTPFPLQTSRADLAISPAQVGKPRGFQ
ncbi:MAG: glycosyltransferase family 2 protein [Planctomycetaceae bacterium]